MGVFNIALIGGGGISRAHIAAAKASDGRIGVAAVVDPSESARKGVADVTGAAAFESVGQLLSSDVAKRLNGLVVCTPPSARIPIVKAALERGVPVLVEKPLAHRLSDAKQLAELAAKHRNVVTAVGYCHRFTPAIVEMKKRIDAGSIGAISRFENTFAAPNPKMAQHWMSDPAISGGGSFIDTGCHSLDLFLFLIGGGTVAAAEFVHAWPGRGESSATVMVRSDARRVAGVIQSGWLEPARFVVTVVGTEGTLQYDYEKPTELLHRPNVGDPRKIAVETHDLRFQRQLEAFADAARAGVNRVLATFQEGVKTAELVEAAQRLAGAKRTT
jgi:predicted dehydrogenase